MRVSGLALGLGFGMLGGLQGTSYLDPKRNNRFRTIDVFKQVGYFGSKYTVLVPVFVGGLKVKFGIISGVVIPKG